MTRIEPESIDRDERLGEAIEAYLQQAEAGNAPDAEEFAHRYPDLADDLREALEGLAVVQGLVGDPGGPGRVLEAGRRIAGYRIVRELGRGGMGVVYEAVHVDLDRPVALKVLGTHAAPDSTGRRRFLNEAKTAAALHHTHIVPVFDVGQVGGLCYYAMQRIEGSGLDRVLRTLRRDRSTAAGSGSHRSGRSILGRSRPRDDDPALSAVGDASLSWTGSGAGTAARRPRLQARDDEAPAFEPPRGSAYYRWVAQVGRQAAEALTYAHRRGVVHRDVKPSNLLVDARGVIWVADFGLARRLADPGITQTDSLLGTPRYMSPEQTRGGLLDGRTDVYSLGATLYELLALRPPFEGRTAAELVSQITGKEPAPVRRFDPRVPRDLETIVLKAMARRPADRYAGAAEFAEDLRRFLDTEPVHARRIGPVGRAWRFARRHPSLSAVSTVSALTVLGVATWAYVSVLTQRNEAIKAQGVTRNALLAAEKANLGEQAARSESLWRYAGAIRNSATTERRKIGLKALAEAAELHHGPSMSLLLRDEAVEFLALRDVEPRPSIPTGSTWGLAFSDDGETLASLSDDGDELRLWDDLGAEPARHVSLRAETRAAPSDDPRNGRRDRPRRGGPGMFRFGSGVANLGRLVAVVLPDGHGVRLVVPATGAQVGDIQMPDRRIEGILGSPDGSRLITFERVDEPGGPGSRRGGPVDPPPSARLRAVLWDPLHTEQPIATLAVPDPAEDAWWARFPRVAFAPDGQTIATALIRSDPETLSTIVLHDAETGDELARKAEVGGAVWALALGPDGLLAAAVSDGSVRFWSGPNLDALPGFYHNQNVTVALAFSPDGRMLALAGAWSGGIELWDPATNALVATVRTPEQVSHLAFDPDGKTLAAAGGSSTQLWALVEPVGRTRLSGFEQPVTNLDFGPGGLLAMTARDGELRVWNPERCPSSPHVLDDLRALAVAFDSEGRLLVAGDNTLSCLDADTFAVLASQSIRPGAGNRQFSLPRLPMTRGGPGRAVALARLNEVFLWPADGSETLQTIQPPAFESRRRPGPGFGPGRGGPNWGAIAASADGSRLYLQSQEGELHAWAVEPDATARPLPWSGRIRGVNTMALSPDDRTLAIGDRDGLVHLLDAETGRRLSPLVAEVEADGPITALAYSPDGRILAVGQARGRIALWSVANPAHPATMLHLPGHRGVFALAFDTEQRRLASTGDDKIVQVWDLDTVRERLAALALDW